MSVGQWSTTAANNATADPSINWQEGQAPSTVNDSARAMMAALALWFQSAEWLNLADVPTYVSGTQFTVPTNRTSVYTVGRRVRAMVTAGTIYGTISASAYTSLTTVTVTWDSGSLDSGLSEVDVGIINSANSSLAQVSGNFTAGGTITGTNVTMTSDERLKEDWRPMARDFLERMAAVLHGTFAWRESGKRSAGVGAQSLREVLPEVVHEDASGKLSVDYGAAALVTVLEIIPLVLRLLDASGEAP
jgi:hypothetical protein